MKMHCSKCGALAVQDAAFCGACGSPVVVPSSTGATKSANRHRAVVAGLLAAIALIVLIGVVMQAMTPGGAFDRLKAEAASLEATSEATSKTAARIDINNLGQAVRLYKLDNRAYPTTEQGLSALTSKPSVGPEARNWKQYLDRLPKDPWGKEYQYVAPGKNGQDFEITSSGLNTR